MAAKVEGSGGIAVLVAAVFVANWVSAKYWSYPFVWCWGKTLLQPVLEPWLFVIHFIALAYFLMCAWTVSTINIVRGLMVLIIVFGLPTFAEILLRLGKSCG
ncbi:hypothetical protein ACVIHC_002174 [Bradyrhizobium diazoefficiens]